ncbi:MAG: LysR substrate-binding domain-containing protein [Azospirillaceae bacterium]|nr:LysR substrate-binding domain-containing protein [Azospirillaceae bacterium]
MNVRQLQVFRAIMRDGTITAAANSLGVSQPAVSKLLAHLEHRLGCLLFERIGGRLVPTAEARLLFPDADRVFRQMEALSALARDINASRIGLLRIGVSLPLAAALLPSALTRFRARHPEVKIHLHTLPKREIAEGLALGDIDVAVTLSAIVAPTIRVEPLFTVEMCAVLAADDPLAAVEVVTPALLRQRALISYGSHAEMGAALDAAFASDDQVREVTIQVATSVAALPFARQGLGIALIDGLALWAPIPGLVVRPFRPTVAMTVSLSVNEARPTSRFLSSFRDAIRQAVAATTESTVAPG